MKYDGRMADAQLARVQGEMRRCRRCPDAGFPVQAGAVFSGRAGADWMLVGQAPGQTESDLGVPFCGPSGRRLFRWLAECGWDEDAFRASSYITAITKCFPGRATSGRGDRAPSRRERLLCRPHLECELRLVRPRAILAVGGAAIEHFLGPGTLDERVGRTFVAAGRVVVPLPHPSGANLWLNRPRSRVLLREALAAIRAVRDEERA